MKYTKYLSMITIIALTSIGCNENKKNEQSPLVLKATQNGLKAIPTNESELHKIINNPQNPVTKDKVEFGKKLFFEPRLSKSNLISCNSCHNLGLGGDDGVSSAIGHGWTSNPHHLNSPTVYNAVFADKQFWDGRSPDLENQAQGPILASPEMASTKEIVVNTITSIPEYLAEYKKVFKTDEVTYEKITSAIGTFERTLVTPSRFDDFLNGNSKALTKEEEKGLETFIDKGCVSCHNGYALGGTMQPFPAVKPFKYSNIGNFSSKIVKVPTLRNITETAPYFHNGSSWDLSETVKIMGETQLGLDLKDNEVQEIVTFLKTLDGRKPVISYPILPKETSQTPKPNLDIN